MKAPQLNGQHQVESTIQINAPVDQVWQILRDFGNVSWAPGVKSSYSIGKEELGVGTGRHCTLDGFGEIDEYVTLWSEGEGFVYSVSPLGPLNNANSRWWITALSDQQCELNVVLSYDLRFGLFGKLMHGLIMQRKLRASLPDTLEGVKSRAEGVSTAAMA
ncbi:MAG: SRPBCC family protein [Pseudomonadales bacterium]|nr:SRPBCC family protein [Pseudomonadales bacterium]